MTKPHEPIAMAIARALGELAEQCDLQEVSSETEGASKGQGLAPDWSAEAVRKRMTDRIAGSPGITR